LHNRGLLSAESAQAFARPPATHHARPQIPRKSHGGSTEAVAHELWHDQCTLALGQSEMNERLRGEADLNNELKRNKDYETAKH
jgi:hypothetical protein